MNPKILLAFLGGAALASGIVYMAVKPDSKNVAKTLYVQPTQSQPVAPQPAEPVAARPVSPVTQAESPERPVRRPVAEKPTRRPAPVQVARASTPMTQPAPAPATSPASTPTVGVVAPP